MPGLTKMLSRGQRLVNLAAKDRQTCEFLEPSHETTKGVDVKTLNLSSIKEKICSGDNHGIKPTLVNGTVRRKLFSADELQVNCVNQSDFKEIIYKELSEQLEISEMDMSKHIEGTQNLPSNQEACNSQTNDYLENNEYIQEYVSPDKLQVTHCNQINHEEITRKELEISKMVMLEHTEGTQSSPSSGEIGNTYANEHNEYVHENISPDKVDITHINQSKHKQITFMELSEKLDLIKKNISGQTESAKIKTPSNQETHSNTQTQNEYTHTTVLPKVAYVNLTNHEEMLHKKLLEKLESNKTNMSDQTESISKSYSPSYYEFSDDDMLTQEDNTQESFNEIYCQREVPHNLSSHEEVILNNISEKVDLLDQMLLSDETTMDTRVSDQVTSTHKEVDLLDKTPKIPSFHEVEASRENISNPDFYNLSDEEEDPFLPSDKSDSNYEPEPTLKLKNIRKKNNGNKVGDPKLDQNKNEIPAKLPQRKDIETYPKKRNYCIFCQELKTNIARHLEMVHETEPEVEEFLRLKKNCPERKKLIAAIRNRGNFEYNTDSGNTPIVSRQRHKLPHPVNIQNYYLPCENCKAFFSHKNLSRHYKICLSKPNLEHTRSVIRNSRAIVTQVHKEANDILKRKILPPMRRDAIFMALKRDKLIILFGNHLSAKYTGHQDYMVRNNMRFLGRYFLIIQSLCPKITDLSMLFQLKYFDLTIKGIVQLADLNEDTGRYKSPKSALQLVHVLKTCCNVLQGMYIRKECREKEQEVKRFFKLLNTDAPVLINKNAVKSLIENKRKKIHTKQSKMPLSDDITNFKLYLLNQCDKKYKQLLLQEFQYNLWKELAELTLLYIVVFNRKRSGESNKILIEDYSNFQKLSNTSLPEVFEDLTETEKDMANSVYKVVIRGKLDSAVTAYIPEIIKLYLDYIVAHREDANVDDDNPYLFGLPGKLSGGRHKFLETCMLMRKYSILANLKKPENMRTTLLRKHLATKVSSLNIEEGKQKTVMTFMGHHEEIHKRFYRQDIVTKDLMMTDLLNQDMPPLDLASDKDNNTDSSSAVASERRERAQKLKKPSKKVITVSSNKINFQADCESSTSEAIPNNSDPSIEINPRRMNKKRSIRKTVNLFADSDKSDKNGSEESRSDSEPTLQKQRHINTDNCSATFSPGGAQKLRKSSKTGIIVNSNKINLHTHSDSSTREVVSNNSNSSNKITPQKNKQKRRSFRKTVNPFTDSDNSDENDTKESSSDSDSPFKTQRQGAKTSWSTPERYTARRVFGSFIKEQSLPSENFCADMIAQNRELKHRTAAQVKAWGNNQISIHKRAQPARRQRWSTPQKHILRRVFASHIQNGVYPSSVEYNVAVNKYPELKSRNLASVKSFLQHLQMRRKK